ncbi:MAG: ChbG/HpnK family deacetylase, partial [Candidatus Omnitrophica bacterium]|nr:ChbG/HpnK family deacetylase [Candidatus Omnitrophota bacterium]
MRKKKEKRLILNADDLGVSEEVNETIRRYFLARTITGTSIMACGARFNEACSMMRGIGRDEIGVHLTFTGDPAPCAGGRFVPGYVQLALKYFSGRIKPDDITLEFETQIKNILAEGFRITHLDSHEHVHMMPGIFKIVSGLARKYGIPYIRIPNEPVRSIIKSFRPIDLIRYTVLKSLAILNYKHAGITRNTAFLGHFHSGRITDDILSFLISSLPEGVTEIALHPGS